MIKSKVISGTLSSLFSLGRHASLMMQLHETISKVPAAKMLLTDVDLTNWKRDIETESDVARAIASTEEAILLKRKDAERDKLIASLFIEIRTAARSQFAARSEAGTRLKLIVDTYKGLTKEAYDEEMAHIRGLLVDLTKPAALADMATLGLQPLADMLKTSNEEFAKLFAHRNDTKAADLLPNGKKIRLKNDDTMTEVFRHIEAAYLTASTDEDRQIISDLIDRINQINSDAKARHKESKALKKLAADKKKPDGGKKPSDPQKPDDSKKPDDGKTPKPGREEDPGEDKV
ncbi:hypothetical protein HMPREF9140_00798 [Prevotella micans F0438]|uniref:Hemagglutinin protein HagB n=1 Tax=Prevotella micans F0438 TaxID=883158 RepID=H1Q1L0_9BACT|nr:DUF6261 family protein [Prevotella micans]EHO71857.1 hypothetical protein HMPREF9140_00798 [Prevotella micans F0438]